MQMKSDSAVAPLIMAQKRYAVKSEAGLVNLYTLNGWRWLNGKMGRKCTC